VKVLVTSANRKLPLLRAIAEQLAAGGHSAQVVAGDSNPHCLASFAWPGFWQMPSVDRVSADDVVDAILNEKVTHLIPTRDADVAFFAAQRDRLEGAGVACMVSGTHSVNRCLDKLDFAQTLIAAGLPAIPTFGEAADAAGASGNVVLKERRGAGSHGLSIDITAEAATLAAASLDDPIFQPFIAGEELSIDAYRSRRGTMLGTVARTRDLVIGGESQVTTTVDAEPYWSLVDEIMRVLDISGHAVIQLIASQNGPQVVECNPRLGGASTLSLAAGLRSLQWFALESSGEDPALLPFAPHSGQLRLVRTAGDQISDPRL